MIPLIAPRARCADGERPVELSLPPARRSTESTVFCVVEGSGSVAIGETRFDFAPHDVFVVPSWEPYRLDAQGDCVLFSYSDRAAQEALGFWRELSPP